MAVKYNIDDWVSAIPDEEIYLVSSGRLCKEGTKFLEQNDSGFSTAVKKGENFSRDIHDNNPIRRFVCYWYMKHPNQTESIYIEGIYDFFRKLGLVSFEEDLYNFGIYDSTNNKSLRSKGQIYLLKIEGTSKEEIENNVTQYIIENLPESAYEQKDNKIYLYDEEVGLSTDVHLYLEGDIKNLPLTGIKELLKIPNLELENRTIYNVSRDDIRKANIKVALEEPLSFYSSAGLKGVDITEEIEILTDAVYKDNIKTFTILSNLLEKSLNKINSEGGANKVIVYSLLNNNIYIYYAICLKYLYNVACVNLDMKYKYSKYLAELYYSKYRMLAGDKLLYLRDFPTYTVYNTRFGLLVFMVISRNITASVTKVEIDDSNNIIGAPENDVIDITDLNNKIINITDYYDYSSDVYSADTALRNLFLDFYHKIKDNKILNLDFPNPCNTFVLESDGKRYLARLNKFANLAISGFLNHLEMQTQMEYIITEESELSKWVPMELYNDEKLGEIMVSRFMERTNFKDKVDRVYARRSADLKTLYYRFFYENDGIPGSIEEVPDSFIAANLNASGSVVTRETNLWQTLFNNADELISQLTAFYCQNPRITTEVAVSEGMMINKYM